MGGCSVCACDTHKSGVKLCFVLCLLLVLWSVALYVYVMCLTVCVCIQAEGLTFAHGGSAAQTQLIESLLTGESNVCIVCVVCSSGVYVCVCMCNVCV